MPLRDAALTLLLLSLAGPAVGADLSLNPNSGELQVTGNPTLTKNDDRNLTGPAFALGTNRYLAVINFYGTVSSCQVYKNWTIKLSTNSTPYATVAIRDPNTSNPPTVNATQGTFRAIQSGQASTLIGYAAGYGFSVFDNNGALQCQSLGATLDPATGQFLKLLDQPPPPPPSPEDLRKQDVDGDGDPPFPIQGGSWRMIATGKTSFSCRENPTQKATLKDFPGLATLSMGDGSIIPPTVYLNLAGVSDWKVTTYPQQVEIRPSTFLETGFWKTGDLTISAPAKQLQCSADGKFLTFVQPGTGRPQEFVVDWSPGWASSRRTVTVPCGGTASVSGCFLLLTPPKHK